jgi:hypothetical protein
MSFLPLLKNSPIELQPPSAVSASVNASARATAPLRRDEIGIEEDLTRKDGKPIKN